MGCRPRRNDEVNVRPKFRSVALATLKTECTVYGLDKMRDRTVDAVCRSTKIFRKAIGALV